MFFIFAKYRAISPASTAVFTRYLCDIERKARNRTMEQMLIWALIHREFARMNGAPVRTDDAFYDSGLGAMAARGRRYRGWKLPAALWPRRGR
jgi:hypothetical protein